MIRRLLLVAAAAGVLAGSACSAPGGGAPTPASETCTVWWSATDTNITAEGPAASQECKLIVRCKAGCENAGYLAPADGRTVCKYQVHGLTYTVRERGSFPVEKQAQSWCDLLRQGKYPDATTEHPKPKASPSPSPKK